MLQFKVHAIRFLSWSDPCRQQRSRFLKMCKFTILCVLNEFATIFDTFFINVSITSKTCYQSVWKLCQKSVTCTFGKRKIVTCHNFKYFFEVHNSVMSWAREVMFSVLISCHHHLFWETAQYTVSIPKMIKFYTSKVPIFRF